MTAITTIPKGSQISPATERVYHQTNLIGDWKGTWKNSSSPVEFKVVNIRGSQATVEYTHDGHTERGIGSVPPPLVERSAPALHRQSEPNSINIW